MVDVLEHGAVAEALAIDDPLHLGHLPRCAVAAQEKPDPRDVAIHDQRSNLFHLRLEPRVQIDGRRRVEQRANSLDRLFNPTLREPLHAFQVLVMVLGLKQGDREFAVRYVAQRDRIHAEVVAPLGQCVERLVVGQPQHDLRTQHEERSGAGRGVIQVLAVERIGQLGSEALREPAHLLVDDADVDVHAEASLAPAPPRQPVDGSQSG